MQYHERACYGLLEHKSSQLIKTYCNMLESKLAKAEGLMMSSAKLLQDTTDKQSVDLDLKDMSVVEGK
jgi:hypothetical protein